MAKALFFRKCATKKDLIWYSNVLHTFGQELEYRIVETIILNRSDYNKFTNNFLMYSDFIEKSKDKFFMDETDTVYCLLVKSNDNSGILVYPAGYSYARYVAIFEK